MPTLLPAFTIFHSVTNVVLIYTLVELQFWSEVKLWSEEGFEAWLLGSDQRSCFYSRAHVFKKQRYGKEDSLPYLCF